MSPCRCQGCRLVRNQPRPDVSAEDDDVGELVPEDGSADATLWALATAMPSPSANVSAAARVATPQIFTEAPDVGG